MNPVKAHARGGFRARHRQTCLSPFLQMLASITADYNGLFGNQETSTNLQTSERSHSSDIGFIQHLGSSKSLLSSPELSRDVHSYKPPSKWGFNDTCCLVHEEEVAAVSNIASVFCAPVEEAKRSHPRRIIQSGQLLVRARSMLEVSSAVTSHSQTKSADFTMKGAESMQCQTGSLRTLEDASSSSFPLDPQRSVSTSTAATESTGVHISVASLVKKRQEIEEQMIRLQVQLLESFREEWILTGVIPEGFTELQSQVIASNPKLKTTSFPFTHLLTTSQSELNFNNEMIEKMDCALTTINGACATFRKPVGNASVKSTCKDSLTSSFSSVMGDSLYWSQWDDTSTRTSNSLGDCAHDEARELISKRLQSLETDCAIVSQLYRAHKQRATETNRAAFRKAYKCNAQKLKEIHREKLALEEQLRILKLNEQSNVISGLTRSSSLSVQPNVNRAFSLFHHSPVATPPVATLPRRRTLQFPSISAGSTLRLGKLRKRPSLKCAGLEKRANPMIYAQKAGKTSSHTPGSACIRTHQVPLFSTLFRFPGQQDNVESGRQKAEEEAKSEVTEVVENAQTLPRPYSLLESVSPRQRCESRSNLTRTEIKRSISSPALTRPHKEKPPCDFMRGCTLEIVRSDLSSQIGKKGTNGELVELKVSTSDQDAKHTTCSSSSDVQSSSGCYSNAPQSSSVGEHSSKASEVCLRRSADVKLNDSSIRCICSCISELSGNCECNEEVHESKALESYQLKGTQQSPAPSRRKLPMTMLRKQTRRNLNPLSLFRSRSSKRGSLLNV
ncbi:expressed conserved protein [Echinococcus multilocularis]|uniref:Expressed conserved protein n=1 Tax=Echinococcus multilocularis TaxID=6211 RepID=A0A068YCY2_ECHMU|nr:expressed conserved protein [Echinococcus multilocularis]